MCYPFLALKINSLATLTYIRTDLDYIVIYKYAYIIYICMYVRMYAYKHPYLFIM